MSIINDIKTHCGKGESRECAHCWESPTVLWQSLEELSALAWGRMDLSGQIYNQGLQ